MNAASEARTHRGIGIASGPKRAAAGVHERRVGTATETLGCGDSAAARCRDRVGDCRCVKLRLGLSEIGESKFVHRGTTDGPYMAGVYLLNLRDDPAWEISERPPGQLEDGKRVERIVVVVVIIDG